MNEDNETSKPTDLIQYSSVVKDIKSAIVRCRYRSLAAVNREALSLYLGVGKYVSENTRNGKWGQRAIPAISELLQKEMPGLTGFSSSGIKLMRTFYEEWAKVIIRPSVMGELQSEAKDGFQVDEELLLPEIIIPYCINYISHNNYPHQFLPQNNRCCIIFM